MSKSLNNHDKPYMLDDDPFDTTKFHRANSFNSFEIRTWQPLAVLCGAGALAGFEKLGWAGVIGILLAGILLLVIVLFIRRAHFSRVSSIGYTNRHRQTVEKCLSPNEKKLKNKYFQLKCLDCKKTHTAFVPDIRKSRCPYCGRK